MKLSKLIVHVQNESWIGRTFVRILLLSTLQGTLLSYMAHMKTQNLAEGKLN